MILLTSDFTYLTFFKFHKLLSYINHHDSEKINTQKNTKTRSTRVECVASKKRARSPSDEEEEEINKKEKKITKISWPIPHEKLCRRNERRRLKGRFSFKSVDFFTNILLIKIMIANPNQLRVLRKEQKNRFW